MQNYEDATAFLGHWGLFQQGVFLLLCASIFPNGLGAFSLVFLTDIPSHHCLIPEVNLTEDWRKALIPREVVNGKQELSRCSRYRLDVVRNLSAQGFIPGRDVNLTGLEQERCVDGWSYSKDIYQSTIVSEFDLVCSEHWKQPFTSTVYFLGVLVGSFLSGQLSDRFGRKPVFFATMAIQTVFTFLIIFSPSWTVLCILFFISGLGQISNYVSAFVLGTEILTGKVRVLFSSLGVCLGFAIGYMMLPAFAYFLRDWRSLILALCVPGLAFLPLWRLVPESPRWLLSQGRVMEAEIIVRKAAKKNKVEAPLVIFEDYKGHDDSAPTKERHNVFDLLRTSNIRHTTITLGLLWFTLSIGYFGLSLNTSQLHGDPYISCFISAAVEVPAYITSWLALQHLQRRLSIICILLLTGLSLYFIQLIPQVLILYGCYLGQVSLVKEISDLNGISWLRKDLPSLSIALEMVGKFSITTGTSLMFAYTAELYPTVLRNTATGTCTAVSRVGSCIAPFLLQLSIYNKYLPYMTLGTLAVVCLFAVVFLPESFGRPLPQTIQQMHKRGSIKCPLICRDKRSQPVVILESRL